MGVLVATIEAEFVRALGDQGAAGLGVDAGATVRQSFQWRPDTGSVSQGFQSSSWRVGMANDYLSVIVSFSVRACGVMSSLAN